MLRAITGGFISPNRSSNSVTAVRAGGDEYDPPAAVLVSHAHPVISLSPGFSSEGKPQAALSWPFVSADA